MIVEMEWLNPWGAEGMAISSPLGIEIPLEMVITFHRHTNHRSVNEHRNDHLFPFHSAIPITS